MDTESLMPTTTVPPSTSNVLGALIGWCWVIAISLGTVFITAGMLYLIVATAQDPANKNNNNGHPKCDNGAPCKCSHDKKCNDNRVCTSSYCGGDGLCHHRLVDGCCDYATPCVPQDACTNVACNLTANRCESIRRPSSECCLINSECADTNVCTDDRCEQNRCTNAPILGCCRNTGDCTPPDACTLASCNAITNRCVLSKRHNCCLTSGDCVLPDTCSVMSCTNNQCAVVADAVPSNCVFTFTAMGDTAYSQRDEINLSQLITNVINQEQSAFVVHVGDTQNDPKGTGATPNVTTSAVIAITADQFLPKRNLLWTINRPFIITPGDNDWSDTIATLAAGGLPPQNPMPPNPNPIDTLEAFRTLYYRNGTNVPFPFTVSSQPEEQSQFAEFIENRRWIYKNLVFVTVHTVSGANGLSPDSSGSPSARNSVIIESNATFGRINANLAWLNRAFDVADNIDARGVVIFTQSPAQPVVASTGTLRGVYNFRDPGTGYADMMKLIRDRTILTPIRQVLLCYGDGHIFTVSKPLPQNGTYPPTQGSASNPDLLPNFSAVEVPGSSDFNRSGEQGRVKIIVDFSKPGLFDVYSSLNTL